MSLKYFSLFFVRDKEKDIQDMEKEIHCIVLIKTHIVLVIVNDTNKLFTCK